MKIQRISFLRFTDLIAAGAVTGRRVLIRADLNVPLAANGQITDDTRIRASRAAIDLARNAGAAVMVASHLGRPAEGQLKAADSLAPIAPRLSELLGVKVPLIQRWIDQGVEVSPGQVVLLENCRVNIGEKADSGALAQHMAALCDLYVNDAFGAAHRAEASTHGVAKYARIACAGPLMAGELDALARALNKPRRPLAAIVGGSKISTKLKVLTALAEKVDQLIVGGGIANTFMRAAGWPVGRSLAEPALAPEARAIMASMRARGAAVPIPVDVMTAKACSADANAQVKNADTVESDDFILDIGPRSAVQPCCRRPARLFGTGRLACLNSNPVAPVRKSSLKRLPRPAPFPLPAAAIRWLPSKNTEWQSKSAISRPAAALFLNFWKGAHCPRLKF